LLKNINENKAFEILFRVFEYEKKHKTEYKENCLEETNENCYIPRRMINNIRRLVEVADDMEEIRPKEDVFKICYIITCIETLYNITEINKYFNNKYEIVIDFFANYISSEDKKFIEENFIYGENDDENIGNSNIDILLFASMLNEIRNIATHEGDYWDIYFNNDKKIWLPINYTKDENKYPYSTKISYDEFKKIFIKGCIEFVGEFVEE
jgi:hypothetical protein